MTHPGTLVQCRRRQTSPNEITQFSVVTIAFLSSGVVVEHPLLHWPAPVGRKFRRCFVVIRAYPTVLVVTDTQDASHSRFKDGCPAAPVGRKFSTSGCFDPRSHAILSSIHTQGLCKHAEHCSAPAPVGRKFRRLVQVGREYTHEFGRNLHPTCRSRGSQSVASSDAIKTHYV